MVTIKNIERKIQGLLLALEQNGFQPRKAVLFGSYAKGNPTWTSDLDLAIWADGFTGNSLIDVEKIAHLLRPFHPIELHTFHSQETAEDDPFIEEIESTGKNYSHLLEFPPVNIS